MQPVLIVIKQYNYLVQSEWYSPTQIKIRIDTSNPAQGTTRAELFIFAGHWAYVLEERNHVWGRGSSVNNSNADTHEQAFNDMLCFIRSCNYA